MLKFFLKIILVKRTRQPYLTKRTMNPVHNFQAFLVGQTHFILIKPYKNQ